MTDIKNKTEYMTAAIDPAITTLQNISNQWHTIGVKYDSLLKNVNKINPEQFALIKTQLKIAKDSWEDLKNYADRLYEGAKSIQKGQFEKIDPPIENYWIAID